MKTTMFKKAFTIMLPLLAGGTLAFAQQHKVTSSARPKHTGLKPYFGVYSERQVVGISTNNYQHKRYSTLNSGFIVRMPIVTHFKLEAGLQYNYLISSKTYESMRNKGQMHNPNTLSLPITIQYYIRPEKKRLQPYIGIGTMITPLHDHSAPNSDYLDYAPSINGTKYISILFMQGITFAINTKVNIRESIQFMPDNDKNLLGVSVGVGFRLP